MVGKQMAWIVGLLTRYTYENLIPRPEYPWPDLVRKDWLNLNGEWEFAFDDEYRGVRERWFEPGHGDFPLRIRVPFAYQAPASWIGDPSFHDVVWYRRQVRLPASWRGKRIFLHFGAVNYMARVWLNGRLAVENTGGYTPFYVDVTDTLGLNVEWVTIVVQALFPLRAQDVPRGKQRWTLRAEGRFPHPHDRNLANRMDGAGFAGGPPASSSFANRSRRSPPEYADNGRWKTPWEG